MEEKIQKAPMGEAVRSCLNSIPFLNQDKAFPPDDPRNTGRAVLRGVMLPYTLFLVEQSMRSPSEPLPPIQTPQELIAATVRSPALGLGHEEVKELLTSFGSGKERDWGTIALDISLSGIKHPLQQLSQQIIEKLSPQAREELTRLEMSSH